MVAHLDGEALRECSHAPPLGRPSAPARIEIADIDGAARHHVTTPGAGNLALTGTDRDAGERASRRHVQTVVLPVHRFLEPADVEVLGEAGEFDRLAQAPALVGVDDQRKVVAYGRSPGAHAV